MQLYYATLLHTLAVPRFFFITSPLQHQIKNYGGRSHLRGEAADVRLLL